MSGFKKPHLEIFGHYGDVRRSFRVGGASSTAWATAQKTGKIKDLILLGDSSDDKKEDPPACLSFTLQFPDGYNETTKYNVNTSGADVYFDDLPNMFPPAAAVGYTRMGTDVAEFRTKGVALDGFPLLKNGPFAWRGKVMQPSAFSVLTLARWNGWQVQLIDGSLVVMRLSAAWNQTDENTLHTLLAIEAPSGAQQTAIDDARLALYRDYTPLSAFGSKADWWDVVRTLVFIPEPRGVLRIWDGNKWALVRHSEILATRKPGTLWFAGPITTRTTGPAFYWQLGYPSFAPSGELQLPEYLTPSWMTTFTPVNTTYVASAGNTLLGTTLAITNEVFTFKSYVKVALSTSNPRFTPFVYNFTVGVPAEESNGVTATAWDSDDYLNGDGDPPFLDISLDYEGEMSKRCATVQIMDVNGSVFESLGQNYDSGQFRVSSLGFAGNACFTRAIIRSAKAIGFTNTENNKLRRDVADGTAIVELEIASQEWMLDNWTMTEGFVGDFERFGTVVRGVLNLPGLKAADYSAVSASEGALMAGAVAGENWAIMPNPGVRAWDFLREFVCKNGNERFLWHSPSGWKLERRPTTVATIEGHPAHFSSDPALHGATSYPARFAIWDLQDIVFDTSEYANYFIVVGAPDHTGERISQWTKFNSAIVPGNPVRLAFAGFPKILYVQDDAWRTQTDLAIARRSLVKTYFLPPRYGAFKTYFHEGYMPGMKILVDGNPARITRISGASWQDDEIQINYRCLES